MSWNAQIQTQANWSGTSGVGGGGEILYTTPDPATTATNPRIGIVDGNEIDLPTSYNQISLSNLNTTTINGNPVPISAEQWSIYPAIHNVVGTLDELGNPQYDISGFKDIEGNTIKAKATATLPPTGGTIEADISVSALLGVFTNAEIGTADIETTNTEALNVDGPTTLDGGATHGTSIGSLPVSGVNTIRLDVLPVGIDMVSATYITIDALASANLASAGAVSIAGGGALSLAGGDYIEYDSDQHKFVNTTSGNDFTDIYVGNIHPAEGGSAPLRINGGGSGRGVEIDDGTTITSENVNPTKLNLKQYQDYDTWNADTTYSPDDIVNVSNVIYKALVINRNLAPTAVIFPEWEYGSSYFANEYVSYLVDDSHIIYRALYDIPESVLSPFGDPTVWALTTIDSPSEIWTQVGTIVSNSIIFTPEPAEEFYLTIVKPVNEPISIIQRSTLTNVESERGTIYDSTFNPPPFGTATADLNMEGYNITNANIITSQTLVVPQQDLAGVWNATTLYTTGDNTIRTSKLYNCNRQNLGVDPSAIDIPFWLPDTPYVLNQVITIGSTFNFKCILSYAGGTTTPNLDPTHWVSEPDGGIGIYWTYLRDIVNGSIKYAPLTADTTYSTFAKPTGEDGIYIIQRDKTTNEVLASGRIYDSAGFPPPPFDPSITTDLNLNDNDINNVGTLRTNNLAVGSAGGGINVLDDLVGTGKVISEFNTLNLTGTETTPVSINLYNSTDNPVIIISNGADETQSADIACYGTLQIASADSVGVYGATGATLGAITGNIVVGAEDGEATFGASGDVNVASITGIVNIVGTDGVDISSSAGVVQTNATLIAKKAINIQGSFADGNPALIGLTDTTTTKEGGLLMDNGDTLSLLANTDILLSANGGDLSLTATGDINVASVIVNGQNVSNVDYVSLYYSKFGIPDTSDFAWFRWYDNVFSYSLNSGASWVPVASDWSKYSAQQDVDMADFGLTNVGTINNNPILKYGEFASDTQQTLASANDPTQVVFDFDTGNAGATGFTLSSGDIVCASSGVYRVILEIFFSKATGGTAHTDTWFRINGDDVPYSNNQYHFSGTDEREPLTISRILTLNADDVLSVYWASDNANVVLEPNVAQTTPFAHPESPSVLINLVCV